MLRFQSTLKVIGTDTIQQPSAYMACTLYVMLMCCMCFRVVRVPLCKSSDSNRFPVTGDSVPAFALRVQASARVWSNLPSVDDIAQPEKALCRCYCLLDLNLLWAVRESQQILFNAVTIHIGYMVSGVGFNRTYMSRTWKYFCTFGFFLMLFPSQISPWWRKINLTYKRIHTNVNFGSIWNYCVVKV